MRPDQAVGGQGGDRDKEPGRKEGAKKKKI